MQLYDRAIFEGMLTQVPEQFASKLRPLLDRPFWLTELIAPLSATLWDGIAEGKHVVPLPHKEGALPDTFLVVDKGNEPKWEVHDQYADIVMVLAGAMSVYLGPAYELPWSGKILAPSEDCVSPPPAAITFPLRRVDLFAGSVLRIDRRVTHMHMGNAVMLFLKDLVAFDLAA